MVRLCLALPVVRPGLASALLSPPPPLVVVSPPPPLVVVSPPPPLVVVSPPTGGEVPLGEEEEQGGPAGLHLGDLLLRPNHQVQVVLPPVPHDFLGLVPLLQLVGRNIFLWQVSARGLSLF